MKDTFSGWLTADEVAEHLGVAHVSQVTRAFKAGKLKREKVNGRWLYDPATVREAVTGVPSADEESDDDDPQPVRAVMAPAADSVLAGGATMLRASGDLVTKLVDAVLRSQQQQTVLVETISKSMVGVVERLDARCATLENLQVDFVKAREEFLSKAAEREVAAYEAAGNLALKEKAVACLAENLEPLLELAKVLVTKKPELETTDAADESHTLAEHAETPGSE